MSAHTVLTFWSPLSSISKILLLKVRNLITVSLKVLLFIDRIETFYNIKYILVLFTTTGV